MYKYMKRKLTDELGMEMRAAYEAGSTLKDLASKYQVTPMTVRAELQRAGCILRRRGGTLREWTEVERRQIHDAYAAGENISRIARRHSTGPGVIRRTLLELGVDAVCRQRGPNAGNWKGGRTRDGAGYWRVKLDPADPLYSMAAQDGKGYVLEHRLVLARSLARPLLRAETVHHINGDRGDNRIENLQLRQGAHGRGISMRCRGCGSHDVEAVRLVNFVDQVDPRDF